MFQASYILPSNFEDVATGVLKVLNNLAFLDLKFIQRMLVRGIISSGTLSITNWDCSMLILRYKLLSLIRRDTNTRSLTPS